MHISEDMHAESILLGRMQPLLGENNRYTKKSLKCRLTIAAAGEGTKSAQDNIVPMCVVVSSIALCL